MIYFGSTSPALSEALDQLELHGMHLNSLRLRAYPFPDSVAEFVAQHSHVYVVEQNRDAQMKSLLVCEFGCDPAVLPSVLHFDGTPITARFIAAAILAREKWSLEQRLASKC